MRRFNSLLFISVVLSLTGCQTYSPRPLDLEHHAAQWRDRRADDASVRAYIELLREAHEGEHSPIVVFHPDGVIDLHHGEWVALVYNADLRLARADRVVAQAIADHAGLWDDHTISIDVLHILSGATNPWIAGGAVGLTLPLSGRLRVERALSVADVDVAVLRVLEQERETVRQLRRAWLEWSILHHHIALNKDLLFELDSITTTANRLAELGEMIRTESSLFVMEQVTREIERDVLRERQRAVEEEIRQIMGLSPEAPLLLLPRVRLVHIEVNGDWRKPQELEERNIELARLRAAYAAAEERLHLEVRRQYPDLTLGPQYEHESNQSRIGFIAGIPLPILNANRQGIAEAEANRDRARAEFETAYERIVGRLMVLRRLRSAARLEQSHIDSRLAPLIDRQVNDARQLLDIGEGSPLALLEGIVRRHDAKLRALHATGAEADADIELARLTEGGDAPTMSPAPTTSPQEEQP